MISTRHGPESVEPAQRERSVHGISVVHAVTLAVIACMAVAAYLCLERAIHVQREAQASIGLTERQGMLSQRIASLTAQYALGNAALRADLTAAADEFEQAHWRLIAGDARAGFGSVLHDSALHVYYFEGSAPLDAAVTTFVAQVRRVAALSPHDPRLRGRVAPVFFAARQPLLAGLAGAVRIRQEHAGRQLSMLRGIGATILGTMLAALLTSVLSVYRPMALRIAGLVRTALELTGAATIDPLTGLLNKRSFQARGEIEIQKARRYKRPVSLLMIDADQLPAIGNEYGRDGGDVALKALTSSFFDGTRVSDLIARVDAEQFAILLPETSSAGAELLAERLRQRVNDLTFPIRDELVSCTISVGVAAAEKDASFLWPTLKRADDALFEAKMRGRNQVYVARAA
jgi:diguanylate cyclase (GGDEF)-like protein